LATLYTHPNRPGEAATLLYGEEATGETGTYAMVSNNDKPSYALTVGASGQVEQVFPPEAQVATSTSSVEASAITACDVLCNMGCDLIVGGVLCFAVAALVCSFTGPGVLLCAFAIGGTCGVINTTICLVTCDLWICEKDEQFYCPCNRQCYNDLQACVSGCIPNLGCFTGICAQAACV
jgi:hypothetical protein